MRPSRIIVGEVRAEECLDLLLALNAGLPTITVTPGAGRPVAGGVPGGVAEYRIWLKAVLASTVIQREREGLVERRR